MLLLDLYLLAQDRGVVVDVVLKYRLSLAQVLVHEASAVVLCHSCCILTPWLTFDKILGLM